MPVLEHIPTDPRDQVLQDAAKKLICHCDTVVDVGVNYMQNTRAFLRFVGRRGQVIGIEPNQILYDKIKQYDLKVGPKFVVHNKLVSDKTESVTFRQFDDPYSGLSGILKSMPADSLTCTMMANADYQDIDMDTVTLDQLLSDQNPAQRVGLIKIDTEGADCAVVRGAQQLIHRDRPPIIIELCDHTIPELPALLSDIDYDVYTLNNGAKIEFEDLKRHPNCVLISNQDHESLSKLQSTR